MQNQYIILVKKHLVGLLMLLAGAFALAMLIGIYFAWRSPKADVQPDTLMVTEVEKDKVPHKFPANVPIEANAPIKKNFHSVTPDGEFQSTRVFETSKSLDENFALYKDFLEKDGWKILTTMNEPNYKLVIGEKDNTQLHIAVGETNDSGKVKTVTISYIE